MSDCFRGQAYIASLQIVLDVMAKHWLVIFLGYELICFLNTKVAYQRIVVMPANKLCPDNFWDIREALVVENPINIILALLAELLTSLELPGLLIFGLHFV